MEESTGGRGEIKIGGDMVKVYDVIVIGAGHAGCEAALAAARMGCDTLVLTMKLDHIALMPCNPSIGGPAKGHLAREVDALGGEMGRNTDKTFIQIRMLNTGKGPRYRPFGPNRTRCFTPSRCGRRWSGRRTSLFGRPWLRG